MSITALKKREYLPDFIKGMAVLLMIQVHIVELFANQGIYDSTLGKILLFLGGPPVAPLFVGFMGFYLAKSTKGLKSFLQRGFILFAGGILLNILFNANLLINIILGNIEAKPLTYIFGCDILPLAGLSLIFIGLIRELFGKRFYIYILISISIAAVAPFLAWSNSFNNGFNYFLAFFGGDFHWSYFPFFPWAAYPVMGFALGLIWKKYPLGKILREEILWLIFVACVVVVIVTWKYGYTISWDLLKYYHHNVVYFLWALAFSATYLVLTDFAIRSSKKHFLVLFIRWLGMNVTRVYVVQWIIIGNLGTYLYKSQSVIQIILWFLAITAITSIITHYSLKIKTNILKRRKS